MRYTRKELGSQGFRTFFIGTGETENRFEVVRAYDENKREIGIKVFKNLDSSMRSRSNQLIPTLMFIEDSEADDGRIYSCVRNNNSRYRIRVCLPSGEPFEFKPDFETVAMQLRTMDDGEPLHMNIYLPSGNIMRTWVMNYCEPQRKACRTMIVTIIDKKKKQEFKIGEFTVDNTGNLTIMTSGTEMGFNFGDQF